MTATNLAQIPMSPELGSTLARGTELAGAAGAGEVTLEHVLAALCDDPDAIAVLDASHVDIARLRADVMARTLQGGGPPKTAPHALGPSSDVRRILEAAAAAARGSRRRDINGAIVLAAIVGDARSMAAEILQAHGLTFDGAIRALQAALAPQRETRAPVSVADDVLARARERVQSRATPSLRQMMKDMPRPAPPPPVTAPAVAERPETPAPEAIESVPDATPAAQSGARPTTEAATSGDPHEPQLPVGPQPDSRSDGEAPASIQNSNRNAVRGPNEPGAAPVAADPALPFPSQPEPAAPRGVYPATEPMSGPASGPRHGSLAAAPAFGSDIPDFMRERRGPGTALPPPIPQSGPAGSSQGPFPGAPLPGAAFPGAPLPGALPPVAHGRMPMPPQSQPGMRPLDRPGPRVAPQRQAKPQRGAKERRGKAMKVEPGKLAENIPRTMRVGQTVRVEIRIAKASVDALSEGLEGGGAAWQHKVMVTKAMAVRLRAPEGGFFIETASPETQWIENSIGYPGDDFASWRFLITPQLRGWSRLQIIASARTVGADGVAAETAMPDEIIEVKVRRNIKRAFTQLLGWIVAAILGGALATVGQSGFDVANTLMQKLIH